MLGLKRPLGYELDVWGDDGKMLNVHWNDAGNIEIVSFKRGNWVDENLRVAEG